MKVNQLGNEFFRYVIIGFAVTAMDFVLLTFQVELLKVYYLTAVCISYICANVSHYFLCNKFVFVFNKKNNSFKDFFIFFLIGVLGIIFLEILMFLFVEKFHIHYLISKVIATGFTFMLNFVARKFLLYKN